LLKAGQRVKASNYKFITGTLLIEFSLLNLLQEEKEKRLEEMFEADIDNAFENKHASKEEIPEEGAVALAGKQTQETLTATDLIIERLDIAEAEDKRIAEHQV